MRVETRRHPRLALPEVARSEAMGVLIEWPNHELSRVFEVSYRGVGAERPILCPLKENERVKLALKFGNKRSVSIEARLAWVGERKIGLDVQSFDAEARRSLSLYIDALTIGGRMKESGFPGTFSAGGDRFVEVARGAEGIETVMVNVLDKCVLFRSGQQFKNFTDNERHAYLILSAMDNPALPMKDFLRKLTF